MVIQTRDTPDRLESKKSVRPSKDTARWPSVNRVLGGVGRITEVHWGRPLRTRLLPRRSPQVVEAARTGIGGPVGIEVNRQTVMREVGARIGAGAVELEDWRGRANEPSEPDLLT